MKDYSVRLMGRNRGKRRTTIGRTTKNPTMILITLRRAMRTKPRIPTMVRTSTPLRKLPLSPIPSTSVHYRIDSMKEGRMLSWE